MPEGTRNRIFFLGDTPERLAAALRRGEERTSKASLRRMRKLAEKIKDDSVINAPVDTHALEEAHHIVEQKVAGRISSTIEVGGVISTAHGPKDVTDYAAEIHENYDYDYTPGPGTLAKQAANPGHRVGGKFLERAIDDNMKEADAMLNAIMNEIVDEWEQG